MKKSQLPVLISMQSCTKNYFHPSHFISSPALSYITFLPMTQRRDVIPVALNVFGREEVAVEGSMEHHPALPDCNNYMETPVSL
jgi:hypothetical protein